MPESIANLKRENNDLKLDCKTVRIFAYSSNREQSNKRSGTSLKTESETGERLFSLASHALRAFKACALCACKTLTPRFTDFFTDFETVLTVLQSNLKSKVST